MYLKVHLSLLKVHLSLLKVQVWLKVHLSLLTNLYIQEAKDF